MPQYVLTCLLCPDTQTGRAIPIPEGKSQLVAYQEHLMERHLVCPQEVGQALLARATRVDSSTQACIRYKWTLPDRRAWLRAEQLRGLIVAGRVAGHLADEFAAQVDLSMDILAKLDARVVIGGSIPAALLRSLAEGAQVDLALVEAYLDAPPADGMFCCGPGPQRPLEKEPFWKSVSDSPWLTATQKERWLVQVDAEEKR